MAVLLSNQLVAQTRTISKEIQIEETDNQQTVTVTTIDNGTKTVETLEGEAARKYIAKTERNSGESVINLNITKEDLKAINTHIDEISIELESFVKELNEADVDASLKSINAKTEQIISCVRAQLETEE